MNILVPLLAAALVAPLSAQDSRGYLGFSVGPTWLKPPAEWFEVGPTVQPTVVVGYRLRGDHAAEFSVGYLETSTTEQIPAGWMVEAPTTLAVRAIPLRLGYQYRLPLRVGQLRPFTSVGAIWSPTVHTSESDTPTYSTRRSIYGVDASVAVEAALVGQTSVVLRGGYRHMQNVGGIGLSGAFVDVGLSVSL